MGTLSSIRRILTLFSRCGRLALIVLTTLSAPGPAHAQPPSGVNLTVRAGYDGYYKANTWIPLRVILENSGPGFDGRVEVRTLRSGGAETVYAYPISLPTTSRKEITLYLFPENYLGTLDVFLVDSDGAQSAQAEARLNSIGAADRLFGVLAGSPSAFNVLAEIDPLNGTAAVAQLEPNDLPAQANGLDMLDVLVVSDVDTGFLTAQQREALAHWIANGGRLIVSGGPGWQKTAAGLGDLLPLLPNATRTLPGAGSLQGYAASAHAVTGEAIVATGALAPDAEVLAGDAGLPLLARRKIGYGEVYYLAVDPALAPLKGWDGAADLYRAMIGAPLDRPGWAYGIQDWYSASAAASTLPNLQLPPSSLICGFLGLYIVAVGPLNYILVRALKRRELAWLNVPVLVILFTVAAIVLGNQSRGSQPILSRLSIVQVWPDDDRARASGIVGVFSPFRASYRLQIERDLLAHPVPSDTPLGSDGGDWFIVNQDNQVSVPDLQMDVAGFSLLSVAGAVDAPALDYELTLNVQRSGANVAGTITNESDLTLSDAVLLGPGGARQLGDLQPGQAVPADLVLQKAQRASQPGQVPGYYYGGDTTIEDIVGNTYFSPDSNNQRRSNLLRMMINPYNASGLGSGSRGAGIYLAAWSERTPLAASLAGSDFSTSDLTLYLFALQPSLAVNAGSVTIPPGLFTWALEPGAAGDASPYGTSLYGNSYSVRFNLAQPVQFASVESLTLHLTSDRASGPSHLAVAFWDFTAGKWVELPDAQWGDTGVPDPERYVGPGGEIRLRVDASQTQTPVLVERSDVTLVVKP